MRNIKFRGMSLSDGWVYGNFIHSKRFHGCSNEFRIHNQQTGLESDIIADTLGEFTGLKDKNGIEIYERDICVITTSFDGELELDDISEIGIVAYKEACFVVASGENEFLLFDKDLKFEVIGNIHQKPELLK